MSNISWMGSLILILRLRHNIMLTQKRPTYTNKSHTNTHTLFDAHRHMQAKKRPPNFFVSVENVKFEYEFWKLGFNKGCHSQRHGMIFGDFYFKSWYILYIILFELEHELFITCCSERF